MDEKSSSVSTIAAASRATSVPRSPIAMPMSAALSAGASLTPSPVIATTSPRAFSARTMRSFCSGTTRAKMLTSPMRSASCVVAHLGELGAGDELRRLASGRSRARCDVAVPGIVAGDHDDADAGRVRLGDRLRHALADRVLQADQADELEVEVVLLARADRSVTRKVARATPRTRRPSVGQLVDTPSSASQSARR